MQSTSPTPRTAAASSGAPLLSRHSGFGPGLVAAVIGGSVLLGGCGFPSVGSMSPKLPQNHAAAVDSKTPAQSLAASTPSPEPSPTAAAVVVDRGDLAFGSSSRRLPIGNRAVVVDYWSDTDPATLSATVPTVLKFSAHIGDEDHVHAVKVSRFLATADDGNATVTLSEDRGEFVLTPPYSYGTALTIRPTDPSTKIVTVAIQMELLVETAPRSGAYFRQTVVDSIRIALPGNSSTVAPSPAAVVNPVAARGAAS
jgi:hypothetical protein